MAAPPGHGKWGGREPGTPNKRTQDLIDRLEELGYDPVAELIRVYANALDCSMACPNPVAGAMYLKIAQSAAADLMPYLYPKRKSVELTGKDGEQLFQSFTEMVKKVADTKQIRDGSGDGDISE